MALMYHPDKVTNLTEEDRESAERQMKEINAAYTELQRLRRNLIGGTG
jgi:preprotein translocase subunit Sec63